MKGVKSFLIVFAVLAAFPRIMIGAVTLKAVSNLKIVATGDEATITVYAVDHNNYAVSNTPVNLSVVSGSGTIKQKTVSTNTAGVATAVFVAGDLPEINAIKVESSNASPVVLNIEVKEAPPAEFSVSLEQDKIYIETESNLTVYVKNFKGKGSPNIPVSLKAPGLISITPLTGKTDSKGKFTAVIKTGKTLGAGKIEVTAGSMALQVKEIKVLPCAVAAFTAIAEPYAIYTHAGSTIKIKVGDNKKNPVIGLNLALQVNGGDAELEQKEAVTDVKGTASVKLKAGTKEGNVTVRVKIADKERAKEADPITVNISVVKLILPPAKLEFIAAYPYAISGDDVNLSSRVLDKDGNPVVGAAVSFEIKEGEGKLQQELISTDKDGKADVLLTTGRKTGINTVRARCESLDPVEISVKTEAKVKYSRKTAEEPAKFSAFLIKKGEKISIKAVVTDKNYIPVGNVQAYFKIISGKGKLSAEKIDTDMNGTATVDLFPEDYRVINIQVSAASILETKGLIYRKPFPFTAVLYSILSLFAVSLFVYLLLKFLTVKYRYIDSSTGLHNELFAKYRIKKALKNKIKFTAVFLDFNHFKHFNVFNGAAKGNELIKAVAGILKKNIEPEGFVCHLGGDDFVAILKPEKAEGVPEKLLAEISEKIRSFYPEKDNKAGFVILKDEHGKEQKLPLPSAALAVVKSESFPVSSFNELLDTAGKVMKCAKGMGGNAVSYDVKYNAAIVKKYKIGWFTFLSVLFLLLFPSAMSSEEYGMILSAWPGEMTAFEKTVKINAHITDIKERPVSNAFVLFSVEQGDGMLEDCYAVSDDNGNCVVRFTGGRTKGANIVRVYGEGLTPVDVDIKIRTSGIEILIYFAIIMFTAFTAVLTAKILNMRLLFKGIDKDVGYRTRIFAEKFIEKLIRKESAFVTTFIQFRDFQEFCKVFGYEKGDKILKSFSEYIKESVKLSGGKKREIFYYWQDHFIIVSPSMRSEDFANELITMLNVSIPLFCEDKIEKYSSLDILIAQVESEKLKNKNLVEIMNTGEILFNKTKSKNGSSSITYSKYLLGGSEDPKPVLHAGGVQDPHLQKEAHQGPKPEVIDAPEKNLRDLKHAGDDERKAAEEKEKAEAAKKHEKNT